MEQNLFEKKNEDVYGWCTTFDLGISWHVVVLDFPSKHKRLLRSEVNKPYMELTSGIAGTFYSRYTDSDPRIKGPKQINIVIVYGIQAVQRPTPCGPIGEVQ